MMKSKVFARHGKVTRQELNVYFKCFRLTAAQRECMIACCGRYSVEVPGAARKPAARQRTSIYSPSPRSETRAIGTVDYWMSATVLRSCKDWRWIPKFIRRAKLKPSQYALCWSFLTCNRINEYRLPNHLIDLVRRTRCSLVHSFTSIAGPALFCRPFLKLRLVKGNQPPLIFAGYSLLLYDLAPSERKRLDQSARYTCIERYPSRETHGHPALEWVLWDATSAKAATGYCRRKRIPAAACELTVHVIWNANFALRFLELPQYVRELIYSVGMRVRVVMQEV